ncbi:Hsp20/alpha crystallin family protein [Rheinheimera sp. 4Y26]|uniref:Hsp20/alpha crystallin family protein n=1 Tax=Rheinheimera sp. 4Y26 TaxID=2977811 RepID=UPI0021B103A6|nr:Hsp20/alpha crystallin family protein [Rheinheimera sp. 4Y26]MCT6698704.1 Hsp20/alpha crystallin family protein [Rheinheimera sp. 4Y26]
MSLIPRNFHDLDSLFDNFFAPTAWKSEQNQFFAPKVDIKDNKDHYLISAELPGVKKEDIHISLQQGVLTLEAEVKQEDKEEKDGKIIRQERRYGRIQRSFTVGNTVHESDISASFTDGILSIKAPKKAEPEQQSRKIQIS